MFKLGDTIEYLVDVHSPPLQAGRKGQTKTIGGPGQLFAANYLLRGGSVRLFDPENPLKIEPEKKKKPAAGQRANSRPKTAKTK